MRRERRGLTLVELVVALVIGAVVLVSARTLLDGLAGHGRAMARAMRAEGERANAERTLRQVVGNLALAPDPQPSFVGTPTEAAFASWCASPRGGLERCRARLAVERRSSEPALVLALSTGDTLVLGRATSPLRYLADPAEGGRWQDDWKSPQSPPPALGVSIDGRALLLRVGERR